MICFVCYRGKRTPTTIPQETPKKTKLNVLIEDMVDPIPSVEESPPNSPSLLQNNNSSEFDDCLVSMGGTITPKSEEIGFESIEVKMESDQSNMLHKCGGSGPNDHSTVTDLAGTVSSNLETRSNMGKMCSATQTEVPVFKVKKEEPQSQNEGERIQNEVDNLGNSFCVKQQLSEQENHDRTHGDNPETLKISKVVRQFFQGFNANGSTSRSFPQPCLDMAEPQEKQQPLQVALQTAAQERDSLKEQVQALTVQLQETQDRLTEVMNSTVKKDSPQFSQTEDGKDYKHLFIKVKQKIDELIKDNTISLTTTLAEPSAVQEEEKDFYDIVQPVEFLIQELKQRNKEKDELCSQVSRTDNGICNILTWKLCLGVLEHMYWHMKYFQKY